MTFWFYIAAAEYLVLAVIINDWLQKQAPRTDDAFRFGVILAALMWPVAAVFTVGKILWLVSLKLAYSLRSGKR